MLCYILAQYAPQVHENILLFFRHKKQSHRNCCRILNINLVIGICKFISSKLQMIPTPARHLQIQFQQIADASNPDQASANPIPASCRCFQRPEFTPICICKSNSNKLQMLPTPGYVSANSYPTNCRCFRPRPGIYKSNSSKLQMLPTPARHLQIQFQQVADASTSGVHPYMYLQIQFQQVADASDPRTMYLQIQYPTNCRCFRPRPGICKSNSSKLQMLPTPARHLQIQFQQIADASNPDMHLQIQFQQIADASNPGQASANPIPTNCRCFRPRPGIYKSNSSKLQMLPTPARHLQIQFQQVADASTSGVHPYMYLQIQFQQVADASDPDQASVAPKTTNQRCPPVNFLLKFAGGHLYCISISSNSYICLFLIHRGLSRPVSWHLFWTFPVFHRFPYALLWKSLPTRPLLLLSVPDGFCPR